MSNAKKTSSMDPNNNVGDLNVTEILTAFADRSLGSASVAGHFKNNHNERLLWKGHIGRK